MKFKKLSAVLLTLALIIGFSGCSAESAAEKNLASVLSCMFTAPDARLPELYEAMSGEITLGGTPPADTDDQQKAQAAYTDYLKTQFSEKVFTEKYYAAFLETDVYAYGISMLCVQCNVESTAGTPEITVKSAADHAYTFSVPLTLSHDGKETAIDVTGSAQTDESGRISFLRVVNLEEVQERILAL